MIFVYDNISLLVKEIQIHSFTLLDNIHGCVALQNLGTERLDRGLLVWQRIRRLQGSNRANSRKSILKTSFCVEYEYSGPADIAYITFASLFKRSFESLISTGPECRLPPVALDIPS
jgi:hypothetical protein